MDPYSSEERQKRISELVGKCVKEEAELAQIEDFIQKLPNTEQMRGSGSSSRSRRTGAPDALDKEQMVQKLRDDQARKRENIALLWRKIHDLQAQDRATK